MKIFKTLFLVTIFSVFSVNSFSQAADKIIGYWLSKDGDGQIQIYKKNGKYFGKLVWMDEPNNPDGTPKLDIENPNEKLRSRKKLGMVILKNFKYDADDEEWEGGTIYDPESGRTYKSYMWFEDGNTSKLNLRGYIGFSLLGRTSEWTREKSKRTD